MEPKCGHYHPTNFFHHNPHQIPLYLHLNLTWFFLSTFMNFTCNILILCVVSTFCSLYALHFNQIRNKKDTTITCFLGNYSYNCTLATFMGSYTPRSLLSFMGLCLHPKPLKCWWTCYLLFYTWLDRGRKTWHSLLPCKHLQCMVHGPCNLHPWRRHLPWLSQP